MKLNALSPRWWSPLPLFAGFTVTGADANAFLQGQLTNDVNALTQGRSQRTGYCTPKGRLMASFLQWRIAEDAIGHLLPASLFESTTKRLKMFVLRSKAVFSGPESAFTAFGLWIDSEMAGVVAGSAGDVVTVEGLTEGQAWVIRATDSDAGPRAWLIADRAATNQVQVQLNAHSDRMRPEESWLYAEVASGQAWVWPQTLEAFVPQMINFELIGGVSFKKGCYPGQEVVARSQYLGKLKRRTFHVSATISADTVRSLFGERSANGGHPLAVLLGADVWSTLDATQPVGQVVDAAHAMNADGTSSTDTVHLLIEATLDAGSHGGLRLGGLSTPFPQLTSQSLPYSLVAPE